MRKGQRSNLIAILAILLSITTVLNAQNQSPIPFVILPQPNDVKFLDGFGIKYGALSQFELIGDVKRPVTGSILSKLVESPGKGGKLTLRLVKDLDTPESKEGYILSISNGNAEIISRGEAGLFYGCQTLEQMLEDSRDFDKVIPACKITDSPSLPYRAVHFDVKHHLDHMNYYYESIDRLARYKINAIIFEFEDKLRYVRQPKVGAPQAISIDEMAALTNYARDRHIEISPLVQGLGHATFILKHQEYAHLRELHHNRWAFCPQEEGTYNVLFDMYRDAMEATPGSKYVHIGGDEVGVSGFCPKCKPIVDSLGEYKIFFKWLDRTCDFIRANGRTPMFWGSYPLIIAGIQESTKKENMTTAGLDSIWEKGEPILDSIMSKISKDCVFMRGGSNYMMGRHPGNIRALEWYKKKGFNEMPAVAAHAGSAALFPYDQRDKGLMSRGIAGTQSTIQLTSEMGLNGMVCCSWDDRSPHMETFWRGYIASAEYSWSPNKRTLEEYDKAYLQKEYGTTMNNYYGLYRNLREAAVFWGKAFMAKGSRIDTENAMLNTPLLAHWLPPEDPEEMEEKDFSTYLIDLPDRSDPGKWSNRYVDRIDEAIKILKNYNVTSKALEELYLASKRNRYHWEIFIALNDFQITAPKLILAMAKCDVQDDNAFNSAKSEVNQLFEQFETTWENLNRVYSKTRFLMNPPDYVPDRYFHFASQREDLTWMIQVEELFHKQVNSWLSKNND